MSPKFCPKCGAPLRANQEFCIECGTRLDAWHEEGEGEALKKQPGEVTTIMNRIGLSVDRGIASPEPELTADAAHANKEPDDMATPAEGPVAEDSSDIATTAPEAPQSPSPDVEAPERDDLDVPEDRNSQEPPYEPVGGQVFSPIAVDPHRAERFRGESEWEENSHRHLIIIGVVALVAIGLIFTLMHSCGGTNTDPQAQNVAKIVNGAAQSNGNGSSSGSSATSESAQQKKDDEQKKSESEESATEKAAHEKVKSAYNSLATSAKQVRDAIETYRKTYSNRRAEREATYQSTQELAQSLADARAELEDAAIPSSSAYHDESERLMTCYDCLITVMEEVNSFWALDLEYNAPDTHPDLLTVPFEESCEDSGTIGSALKKYDTNYRAISV
ncbi:MAG: zinc-ribbon domain-containing protein [Olsenella sp.]|nr:zinc-ribbon domain-containing protein [Olsenella sp.]